MVVEVGGEELHEFVNKGGGALQGFVENIVLPR